MYHQWLSEIDLILISALFSYISQYEPTFRSLLLKSESGLEIVTQLRGHRKMTTFVSVVYG
jgi:hypothetical protein